MNKKYNDNHIIIRDLDDSKPLWKEIARKNGMSLSKWIRTSLNEAAKIYLSNNV